MYIKRTNYATGDIAKTRTQANSNEKIIEIMKENNYRFTLDNNYVMISIEEDSDDEDKSSEYIDETYKSEDFDKSQDHFAEEDWH